MRVCALWNYGPNGPMKGMRTLPQIAKLFKDAEERPSVEQRRYFVALGGDTTCSLDGQSMTRLHLLI